jgi:hypothetical protein
LLGEGALVAVTIFRYYQNYGASQLDGSTTIILDHEGHEGARRETPCMKAFLILCVLRGL